MTTKEYFEQALTLNKRINSKLDHLGALREMTTKASITLSDMPRSSSRNMYQMKKRTRTWLHSSFRRRLSQKTIAG